MIEILKIVTAIKDLGIAAGAFCLCSWMVWFILTKQSKNMDALTEQIKEQTSSLKTFMTMVKVEHKSQSDQNEEISKVLGRINGYKE